MRVSLGAASQMVDRLEKSAMVERIPDPKDRRVRKVRVLMKGKNFVQENFAFSQSWLSEIPTHITPEQEKQVISALSILIHIIGEEGSR
jgi:DNA-binding MarR family transcriptional regulator